jgi:hypothetical protein
MKKFITILLFSLLTMCGRNYISDSCTYNYSVFIAENINIGKSEAVAAVASVLNHSRESLYTVEIIIFGYSSGKEVFSYLEDKQEDVHIKSYSGRINVLLKIKQDNKLERAIFLNSAGNSKEELLHGLSKELRKALCK